MDLNETNLINTRKVCKWASICRPSTCVIQVIKVILEVVNPCDSVPDSAPRRTPDSDPQILSMRGSPGLRTPPRARAGTHARTLTRLLAHRQCLSFPPGTPEQPGWVNKLPLAARSARGPRVGRGSPAGRRAVATRAWGPARSLRGRRALPLGPARNSPGFSADAARPRGPTRVANRAGQGVTGRAGHREIAAAQAAARSRLSLRAQPNTGGLGPAAARGRRRPRSAYARRPGGCNWELQAKFSAVPFAAGQGLIVAAAQP